MTVQPLDQATRDQLLTDLHSEFFVEAGAGTGKTTTIVRRIVMLTKRAGLRPEGLVAITFTETAAAQLRARIREEMERAAADPENSDADRKVLNDFAREIDRAAISTIHSYCMSLLRANPLEAKLPPDFENLDELEDSVAFNDEFSRWLEAAADPTVPQRDALRSALVLGLTPDKLYKIAFAMQQENDLITGSTTWSSLPESFPVMGRAHELGADIRALTLLAEKAADHPLGRAGEALRFAGDRLRSCSSDEEARAALLSMRFAKPTSPAIAGWPSEAGGSAVAKQLKQDIKDVVASGEECVEALCQQVFAEVLAALRDLIVAYRERRRLQGRLTFQDLLAFARDLVRDSPEVRNRLRAEIQALFLDEFQDTDPLQAELAFLLAGQGTELPAVDWWNTPLSPGKLFLVGDPKQSIYRFRRADINLFHQVQKQFAHRAQLTHNFRSVDPVVSWVNAHFGQHMEFAEGIQPRYEPIQSTAPCAHQPVYFFGEAIDAPQPEVWEREAAGVAQTARLAMAEQWSVRVEDGPPGQADLRPVRWGDICVLIPSRTNLRRLERAFDLQDIPYRIESGELIIATQEVRDLISCLRAIDDPSDEVAHVAALRSPAYGCSDPELLLWRESGGQFQRRPIGAAADGGVSAHGRVGAALAHLDEYHRLRHDLPGPALIQQFIDDRMLVSAALGTPRGRESWRRYRWVVDRARHHASGGRSTLRSFVNWMETQEAEGARGTSGATVEGDEDAVRVQTVHGAKGLEFPVVILTGWGSKPANRAPVLIADRVNAQVEIGWRDSPWQTAGFEEARVAEETLGQAEQLRLLYVAATRARDHLVISTWRRVGSKGTESSPRAAALAATLEQASALRLDHSPLTEVPRLREPATEGDPEAQRHSEEGWKLARKAQLEGLRAQPTTSPTRIAHGATLAVIPAPGSDVVNAGAAGRALGVAVHAVLERVDLKTLADLDSQASAEAAMALVPDVERVARLARNAAAHPAVRAAISSGRYWREVPIGTMRNNELLEGYIDLLYELDDGFGIIDYKTDSVTAEQVNDRMATYRIQGEAYRDAVNQITGRPVIEVKFIFAALPDQPAVSLRDDT